MDYYPQCNQCLARQAQKLATMLAKEDKPKDELEKSLTRVVDEILSRGAPENAPIVAREVFKEARRCTDTFDPYGPIKKSDNDLALSLEKTIKREIDESEDPLLTAIRFAASGNVIDHGLPTVVDAQKALEKAAHHEFAVCHYDELKASLNKASKILYLLDNAGEAVFDKILIELLQRKYNVEIVAAVKGGPVLNDMTMADAQQIGLDTLVTVIENGDTSPGTHRPYCSREFLDHFETADLIISKGQGNFETLDHEAYPIFFILMAKCEVVCHYLQAGQYDLILKKSTAHSF